jgi:PKD repeat protein
MPIVYGTSASMPIASSGTFTHTYSTAGTYTPTFTVRNANGQTATASATVVVNASNQGTNGVTGRVTAGPTCPVQSYPPNPNCADRPVQTTINVYSNSSFVKSASSDANGYFQITLDPGTYQLRANEGNQFPICSSQTAYVTQGFTTVNISCDTGIR